MKTMYAVITVAVVLLVILFVTTIPNDNWLSLGHIDQDVEYKAIEIQYDTVMSAPGSSVSLGAHGVIEFFYTDSSVSSLSYRTREVDTFVVSTSVIFDMDYGYSKQVYASRETVCEVVKAEREKAKNALKKRKEAIKDEKQAAREKKRMVRNALKGCK